MQGSKLYTRREHYFFFLPHCTDLFYHFSKSPVYCVVHTYLTFDLQHCIFHISLSSAEKIVFKKRLQFSPHWKAVYDLSWIKVLTSENRLRDFMQKDIFIIQMINEVISCKNISYYSSSSESVILYRQLCTSIAKKKKIIISFPTENI